MFYNHRGEGFGTSPLTQHIGLGTAEKVDELQIEWPNADRTVQMLSGIAADQWIQIVEGEEGFHSVTPLMSN